MKIKKLKSLFFTVGVVFISSVFLTNPVEAKAYYAGGDNNVTLHSWNVNNFNGTSQNLWARTTSSYLPKNIEGRTVAGDFNGDGKDEIAAFYDYSNAHTAIHLFMPDGSGNMTSKTAWDAPSFAASAIQYKVVAGDFDGDGKDEIATFYDYGNLKTALFLFKLDSNGQFSGSEVWQSPTFSGSCIVGVTAGDFNGDGKDEISLIYDYGNNHTGMFEFKQASSNKFTGRLAWESNSCDGSRVKNKVVSGDYDGNKKAEIVMFYDYGNAKTSAWTLINNNDTYSTKESWVAPSFDANAITGRVASTRYKGKQKDKIIAMYDYGNYKPAAMSWEQSSGNNLVAKRELDFGSYDATRITGRFVIGKFDGSTTRVAAMYDGTYVNPNLDERQKIITYAEQFLGRPYVWGGHGPDSFDCAGFTAYVFSHFGYGVSGNTYEQINQGTPISFNELQPGDLVFERGTASRPEHVGIYYGKGQIIHAANPRDGVKIGPISDYVAARRIIK